MEETLILNLGQIAQIVALMGVIGLIALIKFYYLPKHHHRKHQKTLHKVLIVDDDSDIIQLATKALSKHKIEVTACQDPRHALEILKSCDDIDLLITDLYMPEMDGIELSQYAHDKIPVLIISGGPRNRLLDQIFSNSDGNINKNNLYKKLYSYSLQAVTNWKNLSAK